MGNTELSPLFEDIKEVVKDCMVKALNLSISDVDLYMPNVSNIDQITELMNVVLQNNLADFQSIVKEFIPEYIQQRREKHLGVQ